MLTRMTDEEWGLVPDLFRACRSRRGDRGRDDRRFLEALHDVAVHTITRRALPADFGPWNGVRKRFRRLSRAGVFEASFEALAGLSRTAHPVQPFDSPPPCAPTSRRPAPKGAGRSGARPPARRLLDQGPHQG